MPNFPEDLNLFVDAFLYQLETILNQNLDYFDNLEFQFDEANSDQQLKLHLKNFILNHFQDFCLPTANYSFTDIKVPSELTDADKTYLHSINTSKYTNPDLLCLITDDTHTYLIPIEVKSTKNDRLPGSSVQQIHANDWVIFLKHDDTHALEFLTGKYLNAISGHIQFPDRSPRPEVSYSVLKQWNVNHRKLKNGILTFMPDGTQVDKLKILNDWQMYLAERWLKILAQPKKPTGKEPWFHNNLRKFTVTLLEHYNSLSDEEKSAYLDFIKNNIE